MINIDGKIEDAAHVVSAGGCKKHWKPAIESRAILEKYGIDINNRYNGFFLVRGGPLAPRYGGTQTGVFQQKVLESLQARVNKCIAEKLTKEKIALQIESELIAIKERYFDLEIVDGHYKDDAELERSLI